MKSHSASSRFFRESSYQRDASRKWLILAAIALITMPSTKLVNAQGILYSVNTTSDNVVIGACENGTAGCSLRAAISAANNHPGADGIIIDLPSGSIINLTQALPDITESVSITGPGADKLTVRRDSVAEFRIFNVTASGVVTFSGLTISNGRIAGNNSFGGGIRVNSGTVNVMNATISGNFSGTGGGGIYNGGMLNITNCTISDNRSDLGGFSGGIGQDFGGITVTNSTISGNRGSLAGAIYVGDGGVNLSNSTIIANVSTDSPFGGIFNNGTVVVKSTIIALNRADTQAQDLFGNFVSQGFNLIGVRDQSTGFTQATDQTGTLAQPLDPRFDPNGLRDNGGRTQTIALQLGSPAIDKGTSNGLNGNLTTDQRGSGFPRTADYSNVANAAGGDGTDIGAFEGTVLKITSITRLTNGHILLQGLGIPNRPHTVEASPDLSPNSFQALPTTATADGTGALQFDDAPQASVTKQFYRLRFP